MYIERKKKRKKKEKKERKRVSREREREISKVRSFPFRRIRKHLMDLRKRVRDLATSTLGLFMLRTTFAPVSYILDARRSGAEQARKVGGGRIEHKQQV